MLKPDDPNAALALITGQRASAEQLVNALRTHLNGWRAEESKRSAPMRALRWAQTEEWTGRVEGVIRQLEQHVQGIRVHENRLVQEADAAAAKPPRRSARKAATKKRARGR